MNDKVMDVSIVGIGSSRIYDRGKSWPKSLPQLGCNALLAAAEDAGIDVCEIDGFVYYSEGGIGVHGGTLETATIMEMLGIPEVTFTACVSGAGGGNAGAVGLAAMGIRAGQARHIAILHGQQMRRMRYGQTFMSSPDTPQNAFYKPSGFIGPGYFMALMAQRHMHLFGTRREAFAEVAISTRLNAITQPGALRTEPLTLDDYFSARMIADPLCLYDFCLESDGAVAAILTSDDRARDCRQPPARVLASVLGGRREWGRAFLWGNQADDEFASAGARHLADRLYREASLGPADIDVALLYDHFTPLVVMQLEDYGFCARGEGGPFVESGAIRRGGAIPTNTHGGHLSDGYVVGMTHLAEAVRQVRGSAANQVPDVQRALVGGGPAPIPMSALILGK